MRCLLPGHFRISHRFREFFQRLCFHNPLRCISHAIRYVTYRIFRREFTVIISFFCDQRFSDGFCCYFYVKKIIFEIRIGLCMRFCNIPDTVLQIRQLFSGFFSASAPEVKGMLFIRKSLSPNNKILCGQLALILTMLLFMAVFSACGDILSVKK